MMMGEEKVPQDTNKTDEKGFRVSSDLVG